jgi:ribose transport system permease protein
VADPPQRHPALWARLNRKPLPPIIEVGGVAIVGAQTKGTTASDSAYQAGRLARILTRRDTAALLIASILGRSGFTCGPISGASIDNTFNLMLAFTEVGLLAIA